MNKNDFKNLIEQIHDTVTLNAFTFLRRENYNDYKKKLKETEILMVDQRKFLFYWMILVATILYELIMIQTS